MKTTAAVLKAMGSAQPYAASQPLDLCALDLAAPGPRELLVRIEAAGLCHSDLSVVNGDRPRPLPMALGHEACATVLEAGPGAALAPGTRVVLAFLPACGACPACAAGTPWLCAPAAAANGRGELLGGGHRLHDASGQPVHHHLGCSAFASHAVIDERSAIAIPSDIDPEIAALFGCAVLTGVGAVFNSAALRAGESVAIWGLGGVGLAALLGAIAGGAEPVIAIDPSPEKRALALTLGARAAAHPDEAEAVLRAHCPALPEIAIESAGLGSVLAEAYRLTARGGRTITVGLPNPSDPLTIPAVSLVAEAKTLIGSYMGAAVPARDIPRYIALWRAGRLPVEKLRSATRPLTEINAALDDLASGAAIRQLLKP
jgi:alcohol dehydrogenase